MIHGMDSPVAQLVRTGCNSDALVQICAWQLVDLLGGRNARVARLFHRGVAVLALKSQPHHVMLMAKWHRLVGALALLGHPWRVLQLIEGESQSDDN